MNFPTLRTGINHKDGLFGPVTSLRHRQTQQFRAAVCAIPRGHDAPQLVRLLNSTLQANDGNAGDSTSSYILTADGGKTVQVIPVQQAEIKNAGQPDSNYTLATKVVDIEPGVPFYARGAGGNIIFGVTAGRATISTTQIDNPSTGSSRDLVFGLLPVFLVSGTVAEPNDGGLGKIAFYFRVGPVPGEDRLRSLVPIRSDINVDNAGENILASSSDRGRQQEYNATTSRNQRVSVGGSVDTADPGYALLRTLREDSQPVWLETFFDPLEVFSGEPSVRGDVSTLQNFVYGTEDERPEKVRSFGLGPGAFAGRFEYASLGESEPEDGFLDFRATLIQDGLYGSNLYAGMVRDDLPPLIRQSIESAYIPLARLYGRDDSVPLLSVTAPREGQVFTEGNTVSIAASASSVGSQIASIVASTPGGGGGSNNPIGNDFIGSVSGLGPGSYTTTVVATDALGATTTVARSFSVVPASS